jgi:hypothetical protein
MIAKIHTLTLCCIAALLMAAGAATAQGVQTGNIRGTVTSADGLTVSGATVTLTSPALQGERLAVTEEHGAYTLAAVPPGDYTVEFTLDGMTTVRRQVAVPLGGVADVDVTMQVAGVSEVVQVVAKAPATLTAPTVGANYKHEEIEALATPRTLSGIASLAPGVTLNGPNTAVNEGQSQVVINGAPAYDNVFMVDGVDVNDNIFGHPQNLFIEDAIAETQVLTSGISAEYGRFSGGVVNAITKSGGNLFSGSYRLNLANDAWSTETPYERANNVTRVSNVNTVHEGTFGGPLVKDRLWFFTAGRYTDTQKSNTLPFTASQYLATDRNTRSELKLTGTLEPGHTLQATVLRNPREQKNQANLSGGLSTIDPFALSDKVRPNHLVGVNYKGVQGQRWLTEVQYSHHEFSTNQGGGTSRDILDSPFITSDFTRQYNAPYFDATDPDGRNNRQLTGSTTYFAGRHELKAGYEWFRSQHVGGNSQTSTGYVFETDYATDASGKPVLDADGRLMPVFTPGRTQIFAYRATRGAVLNLDEHSGYVQDHWTLGDKVSADLGVRLEQVNSAADGASSSIDAFRAVPRLGLAYDTTGTGKLVLRSTYAHYSGRYSDALVGANSSVGSPIEVDGVYTGPTGQGRDFAAGFDPANYSYEGIYASFPSVNVRFDPSLSSPLTREFTASAASNFSSKASAQLTYVQRHTGNLIEDYITLDNGTSIVSEPGTNLTLTNRVFANSDVAFREYRGLLMQGRYDVSRNWMVNGHWTVQLKNDGNYEGEAASQILTSSVGNYPEILSESRHYPTGHLSNFQRHKVDLWSIYKLDFGSWGDGSIGGLWRYNSARVYTLRAANQPLTPVQAALLASLGYVDAPSTQNVFYSAPGSESFAGYGIFDTSFNYNVPVFRSLRPWVKFDVFNLLNNQKLISWNTTIRQDATTPRDDLGLREGYTQGPLFGQATGNANYPAPFAGQTGGRTLRVALGVRF